MNYSSIIFWVSIILVLYIIYLYYASINTPVINSTTLTIQNPDVSIPLGANAASPRYSYGFWMYVNTWDNAVTKPIILRAQSGGNTKVPQISVYLDKTSPILWATIAPNSTGEIPPMSITDSFPVQKWTYVFISIDTQYVDMYIDGKLVKSLKMSYIPASPAVNTTPIGIGKNSDGKYVLSDIFVTKLQWWQSSFSPQAVWNEYLRGNNNSMFNFPYTANISISKDNVVKASYTI